MNSQIVDYPAGTIIWVKNAVISTGARGKKLAEVTGYRLDGTITYLLYKEVQTEQESTLPIMFMDALIEKAGDNASLVYGK